MAEIFMEVSVPSIPGLPTPGTLEPMRRPNLLYIIADEWRHDHLGCLGSPVRTPHLDALAALGVLASEAACVTPLCVPSRAAAFTGRYAGSLRSTWFYDHHDVIGSANIPGSPLIDALQTAGYRLLHCGKNHTFTEEYLEQHFCVHESYGHWGKITGRVSATDRAIFDWRHRDPRYPTAQDWTLLGEGLIDGPEPFPAEACLSARIVDDAIEAISDTATDPWFMQVSFPDPHWPVVAPEPYASMYDPARLPPLEAYPMDWTGHPFGNFAQACSWGFNRLSAEQIQRIVATYFGMISAIDTAIGRLIDHLRRTGELEHTVIVVTADHGNFAGRYGLVGKTGACMDALLRIPLLMAGPGIAAGQRSDALIANIDVLPTMFDLAGIPFEQRRCQGRPFTSCLRDPRASHRRQLFAEIGRPFPRPPAMDREAFTQRSAQELAAGNVRWSMPYQTEGRSLSIRRDGWKYVFNAHETEELYQLATDPFEMHNRAGEPAFARQQAELRHELVSWALTEAMWDPDQD